MFPDLHVPFYVDSCIHLLHDALQHPQTNGVVQVEFLDLREILLILLDFLPLLPVFLLQAGELFSGFLEVELEFLGELVVLEDSLLVGGLRVLRKVEALIDFGFLLRDGLVAVFEFEFEILVFGGEQFDFPLEVGAHLDGVFEFEVSFAGLRLVLELVVEVADFLLEVLVLIDDVLDGAVEVVELLDDFLLLVDHLPDLSLQAKHITISHETTSRSRSPDTLPAGS